MARPILLIHGGAGSRSVQGEKYFAYRESLQRILAKAYPLLHRGGSALKAVARAVELLEDDPLYNAGRGSKIQKDGQIRMSASIMDGDRRAFAGCVNVEGVKNPIRLAEKLLKEEDRVLAGEGARQFAKKLGLPFASPFTPRARADFTAKKSGKTGTVGAVAIDSRGRLAAATSTGGRGFEFPGRVSDSPTVAGNFANAHCALSATGVGEEIVDFALAATLCAQVAGGKSLTKASRGIQKEAEKAHASFGWIAIDFRGQVVADTTTETLIWASAATIEKNRHSFFLESKNT